MQPGFVDVYDVEPGLPQPGARRVTARWASSATRAGSRPDGKTFYVASLYGHSIAAVDLTNPKVPSSSGSRSTTSRTACRISDDGNTLFMAENPLGNGFSRPDDPRRQPDPEARANPTVPVVSRLTWPQVSTPQNATPFTRNGHHYLLETDEFGGGSAPVGAARIINVTEPARTRSSSPTCGWRSTTTRQQTTDPGDDQEFQGYQGHYCSLPSRVNPNIVACSFIMSGLRVFDIRNPAHPREIAYFNKPELPGVQKAQPGRVVRDVGSGLRRGEPRHLVHRRPQRLLGRPPDAGNGNQALRLAVYSCPATDRHAGGPGHRRR